MEKILFSVLFSLPFLGCGYERPQTYSFSHDIIDVNRYEFKGCVSTYEHCQKVCSVEKPYIGILAPKTCPVEAAKGFSRIACYCPK